MSLSSNFDFDFGSPAVLTTSDNSVGSCDMSTTCLRPHARWHPAPYFAAMPARSGHRLAGWPWHLLGATPTVALVLNVAGTLFCLYGLGFRPPFTVVSEPPRRIYRVPDGLAVGEAREALMTEWREEGFFNGSLATPATDVAFLVLTAVTSRALVMKHPGLSGAAFGLGIHQLLRLGHECGHRAGVFNVDVWPDTSSLHLCSWLLLNVGLGIDHHVWRDEHRRHHERTMSVHDPQLHHGDYFPVFGISSAAVKEQQHISPMHYIILAAQEVWWFPSLLLLGKVNLCYLSFKRIQSSEWDESKSCSWPPASASPCCSRYGHAGSTEEYCTHLDSRVPFGVCKTSCHPTAAVNMACGPSPNSPECLGGEVWHILFARKLGLVLHEAIKVAMMWPLLRTPGRRWQAGLWWVVCTMVTGVVEPQFLFNHMQTETEPTGNKNDFEAQIKHTINYATVHPVEEWLHVSLAHQIEHHFAPKVASEHHSTIEVDVREFCRHFGLPYQSVRFEQEVWRHTRALFAVDRDGHLLGWLVAIAVLAATCRAAVFGVPRLGARGCNARELGILGQKTPRVSTALVSMRATNNQKEGKIK